jgi:hypothetical protein
MSDAWIYICDKDGNAVSLKGPTGESAALDLSKDVESVLVVKNETDGQHIFYTTVRYFLGSKQVKITNENLKVTLPEGWQSESYNQRYDYASGDPDYSVKLKITIPPHTKFESDSEQVKIETKGMPFASKTFTVLPKSVGEDPWSI